MLCFTSSHSYTNVTEFTIRFAQSQICPSLSIFSFIESLPFMCAYMQLSFWWAFFIAQLRKLSNWSIWRLVKKRQNGKNLPSSSQNLVTYYSVGRREKSFRYNSEGRKNGKLIFLFFLQLKKRHLCSIRIFKNLFICVIVDFYQKGSYLKVFSTQIGCVQVK